MDDPVPAGWLRVFVGCKEEKKGGPPLVSLSLSLESLAVGLGVSHFPMHRQIIKKEEESRENMVM
jgi:hypothetical protein